MIRACPDFCSACACSRERPRPKYCSAFKSGGAYCWATSFSRYAVITGFAKERGGFSTSKGGAGILRSTACSTVLGSFEGVGRKYTAYWKTTVSFIGEPLGNTCCAALATLGDNRATANIKSAACIVRVFFLSNMIPPWNPLNDSCPLSLPSDIAIPASQAWHLGGWQHHGC